MRAEVLAVGTELLLGQIVDTNSSWIGEQLALSGIDCHFQTKVGDNLERIVLALRSALARSEAVIVCGGLGPTQDDITREAIAQVMNVALVRDEAVLARIAGMFAARGREMAANNARQADVPEGASVIEQRTGTAPGLVCPVGNKVVYALPGVPYEMREMMERAVLPDLRERAGEPSIIASRTLRTWGLAESTLAERLEPRIEALGEGASGVPTIAFLASGIEGIKVRLTVKAASPEAAEAALDEEERLVREILGNVVFGKDDETMEAAVGGLLAERSWTLGVAESLTGGLVASRIVSVPGASAWFTGGVVAYATTVKHSLLGVEEGPVVTAEAAIEMAEGARRSLGCDVALSTTGVAGPASQEGRSLGTVFVGLAMPERTTEAFELALPGDRERVRQMSVISALNALRLRLLESPVPATGLR
ncbi:MAG TPA: competence/damage-inducible protein A [Acidimicrobiales bacterium]|nr:competence/damage-inducible protein A [Acidimicrobiales bacterium]